MTKYRTVVATAAVFAILVYVLPSTGQGFKLMGPKEANLKVPFEVSVEGLSLPLSAFQTTPPQLTWLVLGADAQVRQRMELLVSMVDGKPVWAASPYVTVTATRGEKLYVVFTCDTAGQFAQQASLEVTCGPPIPPPPPPPPPPPGKRWLILIEETADRQLHPGLSDLIGSPSLRAYLQSKGHQWRDWDPSPAKAGNAPADALRWFSRAGDQVPRFFIADEKGKILYEGKPPDYKAAVEFIQKYGG